MTLFQLLMLGASAFFAFKIYEHVQTLQDTDTDSPEPSEEKKELRTAEAFSTLDSSSLMEKADEAREEGNLDKALAIYSEANIKEPNNAETLFKMGYTLSLQNRDEEALEYFLDSIEQDDGNPFTYSEAAKIYKKQGNEMNGDIFEKKAQEINENS